MEDVCLLSDPAGPLPQKYKAVVRCHIDSFVILLHGIASADSFSNVSFELFGSGSGAGSVAL